MGVFDSFHFGEKGEKDSDVVVQDVDFSEGFVSENNDDLQRRLGNRQIQLLAIGGSIGTALFVSIGGGLNKVCVVLHGELSRQLLTYVLGWPGWPVLGVHDIQYHAWSSEQWNR